MRDAADENLRMPGRAEPARASSAAAAIRDLLIEPCLPYSAGAGELMHFLESRRFRPFCSRTESPSQRVPRRPPAILPRVPLRWRKWRVFRSTALDFGGASPPETRRPPRRGDPRHRVGEAQHFLAIRAIMFYVCSLVACLGSMWPIVAARRGRAQRLRLQVLFDANVIECRQRVASDGQIFVRPCALERDLVRLKRIRRW